MATKYINFVDGSDSNNGNGPDASDSTNKPYKTIQKFYNVAAAGDIGYVAPVVQREVVNLTGLSAWASDVKVIGDPFNLQGFKTAAGARLASGVPRWTAFTTSDTAAGASNPLIECAGKSHIWLENLYMVGSNGFPVFGANVTQGTKNVTLKKCALHGANNGGYCVAFNIAFSDVLNLTIDSCILVNTGGNSSANALSLLYTSSASGSDWDPVILVKNSLLMAGAYTALGTLKSGGQVKVMGGPTVQNCHIIGTTGYYTGGGSSTFPATLRNNIIWAKDAIIADVAPAQVSSDYNHYVGAITGVTKGAHDHDTDYSHHMDIGVSQLMGFGDKPWFSLMAASPYVGGGTNILAADLFGKTRPSPTSIGPLEKYDLPTRAY